MDRLHIAQVAHEVNRAYCAALGDTSQPAWADAPEWQRESAAAGVDALMRNPQATPQQLHEAWMRHKAADGWTYGAAKDQAAKTHPCMVAYDELPEAQRVKDYLFGAAVRTLLALPRPLAAPAAPALSQAESLRAGIAQELARGLDVQFIGAREWHDRLYGSGLAFAPGQVRRVPAELARRLLRHGDLFTEAGGGAAAPAAAEPADDTAEQLAAAASKQTQETDVERQRQDMIDTVNAMGKDALREFAQTNYRQNLDKRQSVESMRAKVAGFIDQFGVV